MMAVLVYLEKKQQSLTEIPTPEIPIITSTWSWRGTPNHSEIQSKSPTKTKGDLTPQQKAIIAKNPKAQQTVESGE